MSFKKHILLSLTCFLIISFSFITISANEDLLFDEYSEGNGFDNFLEVNPKTREFYGGYQRNGEFLLYDNNTNKLYEASQIKVTWENGTTQYYLVNGKFMKRTSSMDEREVVTHEPETFVLTRDTNIYTVPFVEGFQTVKKVPKGEYITTRRSLEFVELQLPDGSKVWVCPQYDPYFLSTQYGYYKDSKEYLSVDKVNGVPIYKKIMPVREDKRTGLAMKPSYVTIHNTGSSGRGANAEAHANAQINDSRTYVSWHFTVDNTSIYQSMPMDEVAYHAGDVLNTGNGSTIAIEICENADGNYAVAEKNAAYLTAQILYENGLPADAVKMHKDWSGKNCPRNIIEMTKGSMGWSKFKALVKTEYDKLAEQDVEKDLTKELPEEFKPYFEQNGLSYNNGYVTGFELGTTLTDVNNKFNSVQTKQRAFINMKVQNKTGNLLPLTELVSTGLKVSLENEANVINFVIVLKGDVNGDGKILANDYFVIKKFKENQYSLKGANLYAADVNKDGKVLANDYFMIKKYKEGSYTIVQ